MRSGTISSSQQPEPRNILLLDFWSDKNRGDAAMAGGIVRMLRARLPNTRLTVMSAFGANQWPHFVGELDQTRPLVDDLVGGVRLTFVPFESRWLRVPLFRKACNATGAVMGVCLLPVWLLLARVPRLSALVPGPMGRSLRAIRSADLVLWRGRNFRASKAVREPYELWALLYNPVVAFMFGKPVMCIGGSIWPLRNPVARFMLRAVAGRTFFFSVRERSSYERAVELLHGKRTQIELLPDLSLASLPPGCPTNRSTHESSAGPRRLGVTLVDWPGSGEAARIRYREALLVFLRRFLEREGTEVVLVHQVTYRMEDTSSLEEALLRGLASERVSAVEGSPNVDELISIYSTMDLLVATRMHSAIFALSQGTPVVTIPYDAGGKWGILDMMGARDVEVPFVSVTAESLARKVDEVWARRAELVESVQNTLPALVAAVGRNVDAPIEAYQRRMESTGRVSRGHEQ